MKRSVLVSLVLLILSITGCGGGGGGGASTVTVSGLASKGPFVSGTVTIYDVSGGIDAKVAIDDGLINPDGRYGITIPASSTPIMIEIAAGSFYIDEAKVAANREDRETELTTPLRAILPSLAANATISVTPFTELAVRKAELAGSLSASVINEANALIAQQYNLPNILTTTPVDASAEIGSTDQNAINYGLALAAVSQMSQGSDLGTALNALEVNGNLISTQSANAFKTAITTFLDSPNNLNLGLTATNFNSVGSNTATTAVIEIGLRRAYSNVYSLNYQMAVTPAEGVVGSPTIVAINEASNLADTSTVPVAIVDGEARVFMTKIDKSLPGYSIIANKPVIRMTYSLANSVIPKFELNLNTRFNSPLVPLLLDDPNNIRQGVNVDLAPEDYLITVRYQ